MVYVASEVNHLKLEVEALKASCKEKDHQLKETQQSLVKLKRVSAFAWLINLGRDPQFLKISSRNEKAIRSIKTDLCPTQLCGIKKSN